MSSVEHDRPSDGSSVQINTNIKSIEAFWGFFFGVINLN